MVSCDGGVLHRHRTLTQCLASGVNAKRDWRRRVGWENDLGLLYRYTLKDGCTLERACMCFAQPAHPTWPPGQSARAASPRYHGHWQGCKGDGCCVNPSVGLRHGLARRWYGLLRTRRTVGAAGATFRPMASVHPEHMIIYDTGCLRGHSAFVERDRDGVRALEIRRCGHRTNGTDTSSGANAGRRVRESESQSIRTQDELSRQRRGILTLEVCCGLGRSAAVRAPQGLQSNDATRANGGNG